MSRARARKQQEAEEFFTQNPELRPEPEGPPEVNLGTFEVVTQVGNGLVFPQNSPAVGDAKVLRDVFTDGQGGFGQQSGQTIDATQGATTFGFTEGVAAFTYGVEIEGGIQALNGPMIFEEGDLLGLSDDGIGVLSKDEQIQGGQDPFPDVFDRINDDEFLVLDAQIEFEAIGYNFLVHEGGGTVELVMIGLEPGEITREVVEVDNGFQGFGGISAEPDFDFAAAYLGVTGSLQISVVGIGYDGEFAQIAN